jgi:nucleoside-diphosphate-sugar epimerase
MVSDREGAVMVVLVTGVAGFIGSHLAEALLAQGEQVRGVDALTPYYDVSAKLRNLDPLWAHEGMQFVHGDLCEDDLDALLEDVDVVFHLAGQPGVRRSWSAGFPAYVRANVLATQRLLEAVRRHPVQRFVYSSSSSVYGNAAAYPTSERDVPQPHSPYGVTKLAGEHLCGLYAANWQVPTVSLRYFTVYGPRQRPDMGIFRFIDAALGGGDVSLYGDGSHVRDFTYVADAVRANIAAASADAPPGTVCNIAGGSSVTVNEVLRLVQKHSGVPVPLVRRGEQPGDVRVTGGSTDVARQVLGWSPTVDLETGIAAQVAWQVDQRRALALRAPSRSVIHLVPHQAVPAEVETVTLTAGVS